MILARYTSTGQFAAATGVFLFFVATSWMPSFSGDQLWRFQYLLGFIALGLVPRFRSWHARWWLDF